MNPQTPINPEPNTQTAPTVSAPAVASMPPIGSNLPQSKTRVIIRFAVIGVVVVVVVLAIYFIFFYNKTVATTGLNGKTIHIPNNPTAVQAQFMDDLFVGNMSGAYGLTSSNYKATSSQANFSQDEKYLVVKALSTEDVTKKTDAQYTFISGTIEANGVKIFNYSSRMLKQRGIWRVDNFVIQD